MRKFIVLFIAFIAPLAFIYVMLEVKLNQIPTSYHQKRIYLERNLNSKILVLGSSCTAFGVDPKFLSQPCYNLANVSQSIYYDKRLTLKYINKMPDLKLVMITISYFSLYMQVINTEESWRDFFYDQYWGIRYKDRAILDIRRFSKFALFTPKRVIMDMINNRNVHPDLYSFVEPTGFLKMDDVGSAKDFSDSVGKMRLGDHNKYIITGKNCFDYIVGDLDDFVHKLREKNINVVFINTPTYVSYYKYADPKVISTNNAVIKNLCDKYNCQYFDYFTDQRFEEGNFLNSNHLNCIGAARFSRIIDSEIVRPVFQRL